MRKFGGREERGGRKRGGSRGGAAAVMMMVGRGSAHSASLGQSQSEVSVRTWKQEAKAFHGDVEGLEGAADCGRRARWWWGFLVEGGGGLLLG